VHADCIPHQVSRRIAEKAKADEIRAKTSRGVVIPVEKLPRVSSPSERGRGRGRGRRGLKRLNRMLSTTSDRTQVLA